jgi:hypothetical protein
MTNLLVIGFDAAVLGNQTASSDESDPYALARRGASFVAAGKDRSFLEKVSRE